MFNTLFVMAGGAIGAAMRYHLGRFAFHMIGSLRPFGTAWGTLAANVLGGLFMGLFAGWLAARAHGGENIRLFFAVGLLGGFTTFSSFSLETVLMLERGELIAGFGYAMVSVILSVAALAAGLGIMRMLP